MNDMLTILRALSRKWTDAHARLRAVSDDAEAIDEAVALEEVEIELDSTLVELGLMASDDAMHDISPVTDPRTNSVDGIHISFEQRIPLFVPNE